MEVLEFPAREKVEFLRRNAILAANANFKATTHLWHWGMCPLCMFLWTLDCIVIKSSEVMLIMYEGKKCVIRSGGKVLGTHKSVSASSNWPSRQHFLTLNISCPWLNGKAKRISAIIHFMLNSSLLVLHSQRSWKVWKIEWTVWLMVAWRPNKE